MARQQLSIVLSMACAAYSVALGTWGCATEKKLIGSPIASRWESPVPAPASAAAPVAQTPTHLATTKPAQATTSEAPPPTDVIALLNGSPITRTEMAKNLLASHGLNLLEQMVLVVAARQRAAQMGLAVTPADLQAANEDALRRIATPISEPNREPLSRAATERLLREFLEAKNLSRQEWDRRMEQYAYLRKIAEAEVATIKITEEMLRQQYKLQYGQRVQIRHIQMPSLVDITRAREELTKGKDFELVARQLSKNPFTASQGGLMPPFTRDDPGVPPLLRETAFTIKEGEVSAAVNEGAWYHLIQLDRRFPASQVTFEEMDQNALRERLTDRLVRQRQEELETELFRAAAASIDIRDSRLRQQFRAKHQLSPPR